MRLDQALEDAVACQGDGYVSELPRTRFSLRQLTPRSRARSWVNETINELQDRKFGPGGQECAVCELTTLSSGLSEIPLTSWFASRRESGLGTFRHLLLSRVRLHRMSRLPVRLLDLFHSHWTCLTRFHLYSVPRRSSRRRRNTRGKPSARAAIPSSKVSLTLSRRLLSAQVTNHLLLFSERLLPRRRVSPALDARQSLCEPTSFSLLQLHRQHSSTSFRD